MQLKLLIALIICSFLGFSSVSHADPSYAYVRFDISKLPADLQSQMKVLKIQFSSGDVGYADPGYPVFKVNDPIKTGMEGGFKARSGVWVVGMSLSIGTADWQHYCLIDLWVSNNGGMHITGDNFFSKWGVNWDGSKALNCVIEPSGNPAQLLTIRMN